MGGGGGPRGGDRFALAMIGFADGAHAVARFGGFAPGACVIAVVGGQ